MNLFVLSFIIILNAVSVRVHVARLYIVYIIRRILSLLLSPYDSTQNCYCNNNYIMIIVVDRVTSVSLENQIGDANAEETRAHSFPLSYLMQNFALCI